MESTKLRQPIFIQFLMIGFALLSAGCSEIAPDIQELFGGSSDKNSKTITIEKVFAPKSIASHHLVNTFSAENLDFICFYSSIHDIPD